ncbi:telomere repeats-binding bouquet formation protein 1-like isoform X2 [Asterias rubens]|uniref:telomere repeats-binding bouquet formation protein 1-like isoform X2 n=1 Tax=Asterias rubens TaxID=7604 RepID=UPI0014550F27|nr:telomere repeats-binding bouquet formation protein 1-like isoform X2 [Asterias rubens]
MASASDDDDVDMVDLELEEKTTETRTDLKLLLDCLQCHENDVEVQRDTLFTIANMCSGSEEAQEICRETGAINFVLDLLTTGKDAVKIAAMYMLGCACEKNVFSQKRLCTKAVFKFLYCQLSSTDSSNNLKRVAAYLVLCLVTNNGEGQNLARTTKCLHTILTLFRMFHPSADSTRLPGQMGQMKTQTKDDQLELWTCVTSALSGCVNNPQNDENQQLCAMTFPTAVALLNQTKDPTIIRQTSSYLSLSVANSVCNQVRFGIIGGIEVLVSLLKGVIVNLLTNPHHDYVLAALQLANLFVSCITGCEQNHARLVNLNVIPLLLQLLGMSVIDTEYKVNIILTLGRLTEKCERSQRQLLENEGLGLLIQIMSKNKDEEFNKAAMYLLSSCADIVSRLEEECQTKRSEVLTSMKKKTEKRNIVRLSRSMLEEAVVSKKINGPTQTNRDGICGVQILDQEKTCTSVDVVHTAKVKTTNSKKLRPSSHSQVSNAESFREIGVQQLQEDPVPDEMPSEQCGSVSNQVSCLEEECHTERSKVLTPKKKKTEKRNNVRLSQHMLGEAVFSEKNNGPTWTKKDRICGVQILEQKKTCTSVDVVHTAKVKTTNSKKLRPSSHSQVSNAESFRELGVQQLQEDPVPDEMPSEQCGSVSNQGKRSANCSVILNPLPECPGCAPPVNGPLLHSQNYIYTLEKSIHTCFEHQDLQRRIQKEVQRGRLIQKHSLDSSPESKANTSADTTSTCTSLSRRVRTASRTKRCPHATTPTLHKSLERRCKQEAPKWSSPSSSTCTPTRRKRQNFTEEEVMNLKHGVAKKGKNWNSILWSYEFLPGRTCVDLKDKYRKMQTEQEDSITFRQKREAEH